MKPKIFAIMGATGHIGHVISEDLLKRGHVVRALGRDEKKLHKLELKGAIPITLQFDDVAALTDAFKDAYAVFSFIAPAIYEESYSSYQDRESLAIVRACQDAGVKRIVNLSSLGADLTDGTGSIKGLARHEKRLDDLSNFITLVHLRPSYFMENLDGFVSQIQNQGIIASLLKPDLPIPMVATRDIGWKAADFLDSTAPYGRLVFDFVGPREVTMEYVAKVFGRAFDHPDVRYVMLSIDEARNELLQQGLKTEFVNLMIEMYQAMNSGLIKPTQELSRSHRGMTTLEEYVQMLAHKTLAHVRS